MTRRTLFTLAAGLSIITPASGSVRAAGSPQTRSSAPAGTSTTASGASARAFFDQHCVTCHNRQLKTAGLTLDEVDLTRVGDDSDVWERVVRKLRSGEMPPAGRLRPDKSASDGAVTWLESELDRAAAAAPNPGRTEAFHRLNRAEYQNAIRDLLALEVDVSSDLPADDASYGFDNIAGVLRTSPTLMERYLAAAGKISRSAVGRPVQIPDAETVRIAEDLPQDDRLPGLPFGTRGGTVFRYNFPADGEYAIRASLMRQINGNEDIPRFGDPQDLEVSVDGQRIHVFTLPVDAPQGRQARPADGSFGSSRRRTLDAEWQVRFAAKAGPREVRVTFLNRTPDLAETLVEPYQAPYPGDGNTYYTTRKGAYLRNVEIRGPFDRGSTGDTPSRRRIFVCRPPRGSDGAGCARTIIATLARRAYRRPATDAELGVLMDFYREGAKDGSFEAGIERSLRRLLVSLDFLFRRERDPDRVAPGTAYRISDLELASRLSFFLWSSIPDDELLDAASRGKLKDPVVLERQVKRMLADRRSDALVTNFAGQWLFLRNVPSVRPIARQDPDFDDSLRQAFRRETELFVASIIREDRSAIELLNASYTFVNERLARHYGIPNVHGSAFRRVTVGDNRRGLLGQGSVLSVTAYVNRTSPVLRGKWILENLLGTPPPPPPPDVPELKDTGPEGNVLSMRDRMARHRANPACASCHAKMDPLGLALENFDLTGRWRILDESATPIDASGVMPNGTTFNGPIGLRQALLERSDLFVTTATEKLLIYALGRGIDFHDAPAVRAIVREAARNDHRFASSLIVGIVKSAPFQMRRKEMSGE